MQPNTNFQTIILVVFGFFAVVAVIIFSGLIPSFNNSSGTVSGNVVVWGTVKEGAVTPIFAALNVANKGLNVTYVQKSKENFDHDFIEALASGKGPDAIFLPQDLILKYENKILPISYDTISLRDFKNTYIEEGEIYLTKDSILALPIFVDPMVMYWNRDIFSSSGIATPPSYWDEFPLIVPKITKRDNAGNITQSAVAFGEFKNVSNAKDILVMLIMQVGGSLIVRDPETSKPAVTFAETLSNSIRPGEISLRFFTEFSDPAKPTYSWNKSLLNSRDNFISERLAMYFGYASEILPIRAKNPHLNFDVVSVPQPKGNKIKSNFGRITGIAIVKSSKNPGASFFVASQVSGGVIASQLSSNIYLPPARRDLISRGIKDPYLQIFYDNTLTAHGWLDPDPTETDQIFSDMVGNVTSGRYKVSDAVGNARDEFFNLIK